MNCYLSSDTWRKLAVGSRAKMVMTSLALITASSIPVMAQSGNVQRGGYNPAANHQDGDNTRRGGNNGRNNSVNVQQGTNNVQRGGYNPAANHQDGDNRGRGNNGRNNSVNVQQGTNNVQRGG